MIGVFDSGFGGLQTLKYMKSVYNDYDYIFLADSAYAPYGDKDESIIIERTFKGLNWLFDNGARIVVLACNTASAWSIRSWQNTYPDKKVLSISIPGVEVVINNGYKKIGFLVTESMKKSRMYEDIFFKFGGLKDSKLEIVSAPELVPAIEKGVKDSYTRDILVSKYLSKFSGEIECLVLGCTHFPVWNDSFNRLFLKKIIDSGYEATIKLGDYLYRHQDIKSLLAKNSIVKIFTTGDTYSFVEIGKNIWGDKLSNVQKVIL